MSTTRITLPINIHPKYLDSNLKKRIVKIIEEKVGTKCTKEYGYILQVLEPITIDSFIDTRMTVTFTAKTLKPEKGEKMTGVVCMLYKDGIFMEVEGRQRVLVPKTTLQAYTYDELSKTYTGPSRTIREGDEITVLIQATKYDKNQFSCFGKLVE